MVTWALALLVLGLIASAAPGRAAAMPADLLTPAEREWLAEHPIIRFGVGEEWEPWVVRRAK